MTIILCEAHLPAYVLFRSETPRLILIENDRGPCMRCGARGETYRMSDDLKTIEEIVKRETERLKDDEA